MNKLRFRTVLIISIILFGISFILFIWKIPGLFNFKNSIDSTRFSNFGSFIAGIFGFVNFLLLIYLFKENKEQSVDNTFFNLLKTYDSTINDLRNNSNAVVELNVECSNLLNNACDRLTGDLQNECHSYQGKSRSSDFYDILYRLLHVRYKYLDENISVFFDSHGWRVNHFLGSFTSLIDYIETNGVNESRKKFYAGVIQSRLAVDELRLVFYYIISQEPRLALPFNSLGFYPKVKRFLVKDSEDNLKFTEILKKISGR
jgi:hypothetical protein